MCVFGDEQKALPLKSSHCAARLWEMEWDGGMWEDIRMCLVCV